MVEIRLFDSSEHPLERAMLRAVREETVPSDVQQRALAGLGLLGLVPAVTTATHAATTASKFGKLGYWLGTWTGKTTLLVGVGVSSAWVGSSLLGTNHSAAGKGISAVQAQVRQSSSQPASPAAEQISRGKPRSSEVIQEAERKDANREALNLRLKREAPVDDEARVSQPTRARSEPNRLASAPAPRLEPRVAETANNGKALFSIQEELDLLDRARRELNQGNDLVALRLARSYLQRFPKGEFRDEARAIENQAQPDR